MVTADEIRAVARTLPRSYEVLVRGRIKFRVGQIVWLALSTDGRRMGCGFPKELRAAVVEAEPGRERVRIVQRIRIFDDPVQSVAPGDGRCLRAHGIAPLGVSSTWSYRNQRGR